MFKILSLGAMLAAGMSGAIAATNQLQWSSDAQDESDPRVVAFYQGQCAQWSQENGLAGDIATAFQSQCLQSAPNVWPVGLDHSE